MKVGEEDAQLLQPGLAASAVFSTCGPVLQHSSMDTRDSRRSALGRGMQGS